MASQCSYFFQNTFVSHFQGLPYIWEVANKGIYIEEHVTPLMFSKDVCNTVLVKIEHSEGNGSHPKPMCFTLPKW